MPELRLRIFVVGRQSDPLDLPLDLGPDESRPPLDLDRMIGAPRDAGRRSALFSPAPPRRDRAFRPRRPSAVAREDAPLITGPLRPRAPLGVRRADSRSAARPAARDENSRARGHAVRDAACGHRRLRRRLTATTGEALAAPCEPYPCGAGRRRAALRAGRFGPVFHASAARAWRPLR